MIRDAAACDVANRNTGVAMREIVLLSGGVESSVLLRLEAARGVGLVPAFIDYAQRARREEHAAAARQCAALGVELKVLDMARAGEVFRAGQEKKLHIPMPHRNLVVLSLGLSLAYQLRADAVAVAVNRDDAQAYASAAPEFMERFRHMAQALGPVQMRSPLAQLGKSQVVQQGVALDVDFSGTYSCMLGYARHCGRCTQCIRRRAAFAAAGVSEPKGFYSHEP